MRIDKFLYFARLTRTRGQAQELAEGGLVRINGARCTKAACEIRIDQVLTLPRREGVALLRVVALPARRGPPAEAAACVAPITD